MNPVRALQQCIPVIEASQVGEARRAAARLCAEAGFEPVRAGRVAIVVTELATNLVRHGGGGELLLQLFGSGAALAFEAVALDRGPGMDLQRCLVDGYSTGGSAGTGLGAVRRQSDVFDAWSAPGAGTVLLSRVQHHAAAGQSFEAGAVSRPYPGELCNGDGWSLAQDGDRLVLQVVDGLGHGEAAARAADAAAAGFEERSAATPAGLLEAAHRLLAGSRGAALAVAVAGRDGTLRYAGIGNIAGSLVDARGSRGLVSHAGIVGAQLRKVQEFDYPWQDAATLIMHTDGLQTRWRLDAFPGLLQCHAGVIAALLYRDFRRGRDDVTVVVARLRRT